MVSCGHNSCPHRADFATSGLPFLDLTANQALLAGKLVEQIKPVFFSLAWS